MARILFFILAGYFLLTVVVYLMQRQLQYYPPRNAPATPEKQGVPFMREVRIKTDDGYDHLAWFTPPRDKGGYVIVMYHGNAGHIGDRAIKLPYYVEKGFGVLMCEYRGYGGNKGRPTEQGLYKDGRACIKWLQDQGYGAGKTVIYGESIGSGIAVQMAQEYQPAFLILEAPFSSAVDVAKGIYWFLPVDYMMKDRYENAAKILSVTSPLLIVHGDEDRTIPIHLAQKLFDAAKHPKEFVTINGGGHSDLYEHHAGHIISEWLEKKIAVQ